MPLELQFSYSLTRQNINISAPGTFSRTTAGDESDSGETKASTGELSRSLVNIAAEPSTCGVLFLANDSDPSVDPNNYIEVGYSAANYEFRLFPGEQQWAFISPSKNVTQLFYVCQVNGALFRYAAWSQ